MDGPVVIQYCPVVSVRPIQIERLGHFLSSRQETGWSAASSEVGVEVCLRFPHFPRVGVQSSGTARCCLGSPQTTPRVSPIQWAPSLDVAGNWGLLRYTVGWVYSLIREGSSAHERRVCRLPLGLGRGAVDGPGPSSSRRDRALAARRVSRTLSQFWGCLPLGVRLVWLCQYVSSHFTRR